MAPDARRSRSHPLRSPAQPIAEGEVRERTRSRRARPEIPVADVLAAATAKALSRWARKRRSGVGSLVRGAVAGAGAAGALYLYRHWTGDVQELELTDELLAGVGRGIVYSAVVNPLLPGPPVVKGVLVGTLDYVMLPWGGLFGRLQSLSPAHRLPVVNALLETGDAEDDPYVAYLIHGVALALLQGTDGRDD